VDYEEHMMLRGKLVDLAAVEEETTRFEWQTESLEVALQRAGLRKKGFMMPLALDAIDVTQDRLSLELAKEFQPDIQLTGVDLRSERSSKAWGGAYFRVISNQEEDMRCIQWFYVWITNRFYISLWQTILPLFFLGLFGTLIFSSLSFSDAILPIVLIGGIFFLLGLGSIFSALKFLMTGRFYFNTQQLFVIYGLIFWSLLGEIYFARGNQEVSFSGSLQLSWVSLIFISAGLIALVMWKWEPPSFTYATHDIDWAPFFIYLKREEDFWRLEKVRYDAFHYYTNTLYLEHLIRRRAIRDSRHVRFEILRFDHSFRTGPGFNNWITVIFGFLITIISVIVGFLTFSNPTSLNLEEFSIYGFVLFPLLLICGIILIYSRWPTPILPKHVDLADPIYHLTDHRLQIFWNLRGEAPALQIRSKCQDPFMDDEDFLSFRDDFGQILLYSVLPRLNQLEQEDFFKRL